MLKPVPVTKRLLTCFKIIPQGFTEACWSCYATFSVALVWCTMVWCIRKVLQSWMNPALENCWFFTLPLQLKTDGAALWIQPSPCCIRCRTWYVSGWRMTCPKHNIFLLFLLLITSIHYPFFILFRTSLDDLTFCYIRNGDGRWFEPDDWIALLSWISLNN